MSKNKKSALSVSFNSFGRAPGSVILVISSSILGAVTLIGCASRGVSGIDIVSSNQSSAVPQNLIGDWKLLEVECADQKLGSLGRAQLEMLHEGIFESHLVISKDSVTSILRERKAGGAPEAFCESKWIGKWKFEDHLIKKSTLRFASREGKNGFNCYKLTSQTDQIAERDWPFELTGDQLKISHRDVSLVQGGKPSPVHECETGADVAYIYRR